MDHDSRYRRGAFAAWLGIVVNVALTVLKGIVGFWGGSAALVADAFHSGSDILASTVVLVGLNISRKPPDKDHPYGHGRAESIAAKIVAIIIILAGFNIAYSSLRCLVEGVGGAPSGIALLVALFSIITKEGLFRFVFQQGKKISSPALIASAWEHRNDAISSVAAFFGISGAMLGGRFDIPFFFYLDPLAGLAVSALIVKMGYNIARDAARELMDSCMDEVEEAHIREKALEVEGVKEIDDLRSRQTGHLIFIDLQIAVDEGITVREGHDVAYRVKKKILEDPCIADVLVHVNPFTIKAGESDA